MVSFDDLVATLAKKRIHLRLSPEGELIVRPAKGEKIASETLAGIKAHKEALIAKLGQAQNLANKNEAQPLSLQQQSIWWQEVANSQQQFILHSAVALASEINSKKLIAALERVFQKNSLLQVNFFENQQKPYQKINHHKLTVEVSHSQQNQAEILSEQKPWLEQNFNLENDCLFQAKLVIGDKLRLLFLKSHHLLLDAQSLGLLWQQLLSVYHQGNLPKRQSHYFDYACNNHQTKALAKNDNHAALTFLQTRPTLSEPASYEITIANSHSSIKQLAKAWHISSFSLYLAAALLTVRAFNFHKSFNYSVVSSFRPSEFLDCIGLFTGLNSHAFNDEALALKDFCQALFKQSFEVASQGQAFDFVISYNQGQADALALNGEQGFDVLPQDYSLKYPFLLAINETENACEMRFVVSGQYQHDFLPNFGQHFKGLLKSFSQQNANNSINAANHVHSFSKSCGQQKALPEKSLGQIIIEQAALAASEKPAVIIGNESISYKGLINQAQALAQVLNNNIGATRCIAIHMPRSLEGIAAMLAVVFSRHCLLAIDPNLPEQRKQFMLEQSDSALLISEQALNKKTQTLSVSQLLQHSKNTPASTITNKALKQTLVLYFTSGSTGVPKACTLGEQAMLNRLHWMQEAFALTAGDNVLQKTSHSFDVSFWEIFWPLMYGGTLVLAEPEGEKNPEYLATLCQQQNISICHFVPSLLQAQLNYQSEFFNTPRLVVASGEKLNHKTAQTLLQQFPKLSLYNLYGPTEAAIDVSFQAITPEVLASHSQLPIGQAINNCELWVLDETLQPLPPNCPGQLAITGMPLAEGYYKEQTLSDEKFVQLKLGGKKQRAYLTGDLAYISDNGQVFYQQRLDQQIKIRGVRIELEEITQQAMQRLPISQAACLYFETEQNLVLFYQSQESLKQEDIYQKLAPFLFAQAIPNKSLLCENWPINNQGKTDKAALRQWFLQQQDLAPATITNTDTSFLLETIIAFWQGYFKQSIGADDNFFALGGHSLLAMQFMHDLEKATGFSAPAQWLYQYSSPEALAQAFSQQAVNKQTLPSTNKASPGQVLLFNLHQHIGSSVHYHMPGALEINGPINLDFLQQALAQSVGQFDALHHSFNVQNEQLVLTKLNTSQWQSDIISAQENTQQQLAALWQQPFNLQHDFPIRVHIIKKTEQQVILSFCLHHIAADAKSLQLLAGHVLQRYHALVQQKPLPKINAAPFKAFSYYCRQQQQENLHFWQQHLQGASSLQLPHERETLALNQQGGQQFFTVSDKQTKAIKALCQKLAISPFVYFISCYQLLLHRLSLQDDFCIAVALDGRDQTAFSETVGYCVNTIALRLRLNKAQGLESFLQQQQQLVAQVLSKQHVDSSELLRILQRQQKVQQRPKMPDAGFNFLSDDSLAQNTFGNLQVNPLPFATGFAKLKLNCIVSESTQGFSVCFEYQKAYLNDETVSLWLDDFNTLSQALLNTPNNIYSAILQSDQQLQKRISEQLPNVQSFLPLTPMQQDLYLASLITPHEKKHYPGFATLSNADADVNLWQQTLWQLYQDNHTLASTVYTDTSQQSYQVVLKANNALFNKQATLTQSSEPFSEKAMQQAIDALCYKPYNNGELFWRAHTIAYPCGKKLFIFTGHHALFDGVSMQTFGQLLKDNYQLLAKGETPERSDNNFEDYSLGISSQMNSLEAIEAGQTISQQSQSLLDFSPLALGPSETTQQYRLNNNELLAVKEYCKKQRTTVAHFYKSLFALTIAIEQSFDENFVFAEVVSGRTAKNFLVQGVLFEQQVNCANINQGKGSFSQFLKALAKERKNIKKRGSLSFSRQYSLFKNQLGFVFNYYLMQSETEFLGAKEQVQHLIPEMYQPCNLVISEIDQSLMLQLFYQQQSLPGEDFFNRLLQLQKAILQGSDNFAELLPKGQTLRFNLPENARLETGDSLAISTSDSGDYYLNNALGPVSCENLAGQLVQTQAGIEQTLPVYGLLQKQTLFIVANQRLQQQTAIVAKIPPRNQLEQDITAIWQQVLGQENIGINDNFFALGGHSLHALRINYLLEERFGISIALNQVFQRPTIAGLCQAIFSASLKHQGLPALTAFAPQASYPLSQAQFRLWLLDKIQGQSDAYIIEANVRLKGSINIEKMQRAYRQLLAKHPSLRLTIFEKDGEPRQQLLPLSKFCLQSHQGQTETDFLKTLAQQKPQLQQGQALIQAHLLATTNQQFLLALRLHHIICDADSLAVMAKDLLQFYQQQSPSQLSPSFFYGDYSLWQQQLLQSDAGTKASDFWQGYLHKVPIELGLKIDYPREGLTHNQSQSLHWQLPKGLQHALDAFCQAHGISRFMLLLLCYQISLARHSGNNDICVGITRNARFSEQLQNAIGFYINVLIIRQRFDKNLQLGELIDNFSQQLLQCYQYEYLPAEEVIQALKLERKPNLLPVVQAAFNYMQQPQAQTLQLGDVDISFEGTGNQQAKFELLLNAIETPEALHFELEYHQSLFKQETAEAFFAGFKQSLHDLLESEPLCSYQLLYPEQKDQVLNLDKPEAIAYWKQQLTQTFLSLTGKLQTQRFGFDNNRLLEVAKTLQVDSNRLLQVLCSYLLQQQQATHAAVAFCEDNKIFVLQGFKGNIQQTVQRLTQTVKKQKAQQEFLAATQKNLFSGLTPIATSPCDGPYIASANGHITLQLPSFFILENFGERLNAIISQLTEQTSFNQLQLLLAQENSKTKTIAAPNNLFNQLLASNQNLEATAVIAGNKTLNFAALKHLTQKFSQQLLHQGIGPGSTVAVALDKNIELIPMLLAVVQVGATYVPMDLSYPDDRLAFMLEDSQADILVTLTSESARFDVSNKLLVDALPELTETLDLPSVNGEQIIYKLYTSGSTGTPKAAQVYRHSFELLLQSYQQQLQLTGKDNLLVISALGFDLTQKNLFVALLSGATVVLHESDVYDPREIATLIDAQNISLINCAPSAFYPLVEGGHSDKLTSLRMALFGGEPIALNRLAPWLQSEHYRCTLVNMYGPTECTDIATSCVLHSDEALALLNNNQPVPLGSPYPGVNIALCNEQLQQLPMGFVGELCIYGASVGAGYWQRGDLTDAQFVKASFAEGKLYKTGDLAQYRQDENGNWQLYYIGRKDFQVKLHGLRIELGDIEQALKDLPDVRDSYVLLENEQLLSFVLAKALPENWREQLAQTLPSYMLPAQCQTLEAWPLTANGKIDRKALLALKAKNTQTKALVAPRSDTEHQLAELWQEVLGVGNIGVHENFFEAGGDSLAAVRLIARIELRFEIKLPVASLFSSQTIAALAHEVEQQTQGWSPIVPIQPEGNKTPIFAVHALGGMVLSYEPLARALGKDQPFYGVQAMGFEPEQEPFDNLKVMVEYYCEAILQTQSEGPYQLLGHSFGGLIAIEIARRLQEVGKEVRFVGLIDSYMPLPFMPKNLTTQHLVNLFLQHNGNNKNASKPLTHLSGQALIAEASKQLGGLINEQTLEQGLSVLQNLWAMQSQWQKPSASLPLYFYQAQTGGVLSKLAGFINRKRWQAYGVGNIHNITAGHYQVLQHCMLAEKILQNLTETSEKSSP